MVPTSSRHAVGTLCHVPSSASNQWRPTQVAAPRQYSSTTGALAHTTCSRGKPLGLTPRDGDSRRGDSRRCLRVSCSVASPASTSPANSAPLAAEEVKAEGEWQKLSQVCAVLGTQWGDEGKGKLVDILAKRYDIVCRCQGGSNAGHTIYNEEGKKFALHLVPSGVLNPKATCVIGNGVVVHLPSLFKELENLELNGVHVAGRILISDRAHLLFDLHQTVDGLREAELAGGKIGTTKRGIGPCYASKATRNGIRLGDLRYKSTFRAKLSDLMNDAAARFDDYAFDHANLDAEVDRYMKYAEILEPYITDTVVYLNDAIEEGKTVLVEGGQATMLDMDFGTYPFVTSSNPSAGGICTGLGIPPRKLGDLIGVVKAYTTRVGAGPFPTELHDKTGEALRSKGFEFGTTTGRPRRCGWLDIVQLKYSAMINGYSSLNLTKLDVLSGLPEVKVAVAYRLSDGTLLKTFPADLELLSAVQVVYESFPGWQEDITKVRKFKDLPESCRAYVERIEELVGVPIDYIGNGPARDELILKN